MEFTEEQELEIKKRIEEGQRRQLFATDGDDALSICETLLGDEVKRGYVKPSKLQALQNIHYLFRVDVGLEPRPQAPVQPTDEPAT